MRGPRPGSGAGCGCVDFHGLRGGRLGRPSLHPWLHCCARVGAGGRLGWGLCANWALAWEMGIVFISGSSGLRANCCTFWGCRLPSPAPGRGFPGSWVPRVARRCRFTRGYRPSPFQGELRGPPPGSGAGCGCVGFHGLRGGRLRRPSLHAWLQAVALSGRNAWSSAGAGLIGRLIGKCDSVVRA